MGQSQDSLFLAKASQSLKELANRYKSVSISNDDFQFNTAVTFKKVFEEHPTTVFATALPEAEPYFNYLNGLRFTDKQNLLRSFAEYDLQISGLLKIAGLSSDLKYLPLSLSFLNPKVAGEYKKAGLWQLTHFQALLNGLHVSYLVDERLHPAMASGAAVNQLKKNRSLYNSEEMAILAYLVGNTRLKNIQARCEDKESVLQVLELLQHDVRENIALFQAASVFFRSNKCKTDLSIPTPDTVWVNRLLHFKQVAHGISVSEKDLQMLNPQYHHSIIPGDEQQCCLLLPKGKHEEFLFHTDSIFFVGDSSLFDVVAQKIEYPPAPNRLYVGEKVKDLEIEGKTKIEYIIKSGDVLGFIAEDFEVRVADLKYWNNIYNERKIQAGKTLDIFVDNDKVAYYHNLHGLQKQGNSLVAKTNVQLTIPKNARKVEHTVKSGESPYVIAKKYDGVSPDEILFWNNINDARKIQIGQKLIIYLIQ